MAPGARTRLEACLAAAIASVDGYRAVRGVVSRDDAGTSIAGVPLDAAAGIVVVAIGKAAAPMARAAVDALGDRVRGGLLVTRDGHAVDPPVGLRLLFAGHPIPDARSAAAGRAALEVAAAARPGDVLLVLLSGGASALTSCPAQGLDVGDLSETTRALLACGADIEEINCLRKHLSAIAGGRLARASKAARVQLLVISDVPGDRLDVIGSGPCIADPTIFADTLAIVARHRIGDVLPSRVVAHLERGARGELPESPKEGEPGLARVSASLVARNGDARRAALAAGGRPAGCAIDLGEILTGEARRMGARLVALADATRDGPDRLLVAGGETVVRLRGSGAGGRSQELALSAALALERPGAPSRVHLLAAGTDGTDGVTSAAGGYVDYRSAARAREAGLDPVALLDDNDSNRFLEATGGVVDTGATGTNVMDLVLLWVESAEA